MAAEKNALTFFGAWTGKKFQTLSGSVFCNQSHYAFIYLSFYNQSISIERI
jgi:hypothetical protein